MSRRRAACAELILPRRLSADEARTVIEPYFDSAREAFVDAGLRRAAEVRLDIDEKMHDTPRHFAAARDDGRLIIVAPHAAGLPVDTLVAIIMHELGHATDFAYPTRFQLRDGELIEWQSPDWATPNERRALAGLDWAEKSLRLPAYNRQKQWQSRDEDEVERTADAIASRVFGSPMFYRGECLLQSFQSGTAPRPEGLR